MTNKSRSGGRDRNGKEVKRLVYRNHKWWHKGKAFDTLRDALLSVWPK